MAELTKGPKRRWGAPIFASAWPVTAGFGGSDGVRLTSDRTVGDDDDFVVFDQPASPEGAVRLTAAARLEFDLRVVPGEIDTLAVVVASMTPYPGHRAAIVGRGVAISGCCDHRAGLVGA